MTQNCNETTTWQSKYSYTFHISLCYLRSSKRSAASVNPYCEMSALTETAAILDPLQIFECKYLEFRFINIQTNYIVSIKRMTSINIPKINEKYWKTKKLENTIFLHLHLVTTESTDDARKGNSAIHKVMIYHLQ